MSCEPEKFACANGCCIDKTLECDQVKQCSDGSDEEQCANSRYQGSSCLSESAFGPLLYFGCLFIRSLYVC